MTVNMLGVVTAAANPKDPAKYVWFKFTGKKVKFEGAHKTFDLTLVNGDKFGMRVSRGTIFLVDSSDLTVQFKLEADDVKKLLRRSAGFRGTVSRVKVTAGDPKLFLQDSTTTKVRKRGRTITVLKEKSAKGNTADTKKSAAGANFSKLFKAIMGSSAKQASLYPVDNPQTATWSKRGGHAGKNTLVKMIERAEKLGFKRSKLNSGGSPDGSVVSSGEHYKDAHGNVLVIRSSYGVTKSSNYFSAELKSATWAKQEKQSERAAPPKRSGDVPAIQAVYFEDKLTGKALTNETLPAKLKENYDRTVYGRVIPTGRARGASRGVVVGFALVKDKSKRAMIIQPADPHSRSKRESYLFRPLAKVDHVKLAELPQVPYDEMLKHRASAASAYHNIEQYKRDEVERGQHVFRQHDIREGKEVLINWSNTIPRWHRVLSVDTQKMHVGIQGGGRKRRRRFIPMDLVLDVRD